MAIITSSVLIIGSLLLAVGYDVQINNDFANSFTGKKLKEYGGYEYGLYAYEQAAISANWIKENGPIIANATTETLQPYIRLGRDLSLIGFNVGKRLYHNAADFINTKYPVVEYWYLYYIGFCFLPGPIAGVVQGHSLVAHMQSIGPNPEFQKNIPILRESIYSTFESAKTHGANAVEYLSKNVFTGNMSPENIQKSTVSTFSWFYEKIQNISKDVISQ